MEYLTRKLAKRLEATGYKIHKCTSQRKVDIVSSFSSTIINRDTPYTAWVSDNSMSMQDAPR